LKLSLLRSRDLAMGSSVWGRIRLPFAPELEVEFVDRRRALEQVIEWSERDTEYPVVIFGPEGCGKTSFLKQIAEILREGGYDVIYVDPINMSFIAHTDVREVVWKLGEAVGDIINGRVKLAMLASHLARELLARWRKRRIAVLADDVFQATGLERAGIYVKGLLNLIFQFHLMDSPHRPSQPCNPSHLSIPLNGFYSIKPPGGGPMYMMWSLVFKLYASTTH
jgi:hypothetical protein